jgi:hypothetical protein
MELQNRYKLIATCLIEESQVPPYRERWDRGPTGADVPGFGQPGVWQHQVAELGELLHGFIVEGERGVSLEPVEGEFIRTPYLH